MSYVEFIRDGRVVQRKPLDRPYFAFQGPEGRPVRLVEGESLQMPSGILVLVCPGNIPINAGDRPTWTPGATEETEATQAIDVSNLDAMMEAEHQRRAAAQRQADTRGASTRQGRAPDAAPAPDHRPESFVTTLNSGDQGPASAPGHQAPRSRRPESFATTLDSGNQGPSPPRSHATAHDPGHEGAPGDQAPRSFTPDSYAATLDPADPMSGQAPRVERPESFATTLDPTEYAPEPRPRPTMARRTRTGGPPREKGDLEGAPELPGFEVLSKLGQGGMGAVWRAVQLGTNRDVAIKVMTTSRLSEEARMRFALEIEVTAQLDHPHIGRLYESHIEEGLCYYAMEFIDGKPLEDFVAQSALDRDTWLRIMLGVCRAVQYAHQKGIIHRDLKPDNVMVTGEGAPKVVDFGIAKLVETDQPKEVDTKLTSDGTFLGTPAYMSPEQIKAEPGGIDTRTDVYALGVMLYEHLVGEHPFGDETASNMLVLFMKVVNEEPRPPRSVNPDIDRDLEALLLKAIARDPAERYDTAGDLADDIQRYLDGEPLLAQPQTTWYVLRKKIAKNRGKVALAALIALSFLSFALFSYVTVLDERDKAQFARAEAEEAREVAEVAREQAEKRFELGREFARTLIFDLDDKILDEGLTPARALFVAEARAYLDRLRADAGDRADVQEEIARAYIKIGGIQRDLARTDAAFSSFETARDSFQALAKRARSKKKRAASPALEKLAESGALPRGEAESLYYLADIHRELSETEEAQTLFKRASKVIADHLEDHPKDTEALLLQEKIFQTRGKLEKRLGNQDEAAENFLEVHRIRASRVKDNPNDDESIKSLAASHYTLGGLRLDEGKTSDALKQYERSLELRKRLVKLKPGNADYRQRLATGHVGVGRAVQATGDLKAAADSYREALEIYRQQVAADPRNERLKISLLWTTYYLSAIQLDQEDYPEASRTLSRGLTVARNLNEADPSNETVQRLLGRMLVGLATVALRGRDFSSADQLLGEARALTQPSVDDGTTDPYTLDLHAQILMEMGELAQARRSYPRARPLYEDCLELRRKLVKTAPDDQSYRRLLGIAIYHSASLALDMGDAAGALKRFDEAIGIFRELIEIDNRNAAARKALTRAQTSREEAMARGARP